MIWIPQTIKDLDNCNHLIIKYQPDVDLNNPVLNVTFDIIRILLVS